MANHVDFGYFRNAVEIIVAAQFCGDDGIDARLGHVELWQTISNTAGLREWDAM